MEQKEREGKQELIETELRLMFLDDFEQLEKLTDEEVESIHDSIINNEGNKMGLVKRMLMKEAGLPTIDDVMVILHSEDKRVFDAINEPSDMENAARPQPKVSVDIDVKLQEVEVKKYIKNIC